MRLLIANDGIDDAGGVDTYLRALIPALRARGHAAAFLHANAHGPDARAPAEPAFGVADDGLDRALAGVAAWRPDIVFSHNMQRLDVEHALLSRWPTVKMMHGYFGTCIGGQKAHLFPASRPCGKKFSVMCIGRFFPRRCGQASVAALAAQYRWALRQQSLFDDYAAIVVASAHMRDEYIRNGAPESRVHRVPLFAPEVTTSAPAVVDHGRSVLFLGRMTALKGGDVLIEAVAHASRQVGRSIPLVMAGDGPARAGWESRARRLGVEATFPGWVDASERRSLLGRAAVLAVPSIWPEPFGLVGLEAAAAGVPAVAFRTGGIPEWLQHGVNGLLVDPVPDAHRFGDALARVVADAAIHRALADGAREAARRLTLDAHVDTLVGSVLQKVCDAPAAV